MGFNFNISMPEHLLAAPVFISSDVEVTFSTWYCCHQASPMFLFTVREWEWKGSMPRIMISLSLSQNGWSKLHNAQAMKNLVGKTPINVNGRSKKTEELRFSQQTLRLSSESSLPLNSFKRMHIRFKTVST